MGIEIRDDVDPTVHIFNQTYDVYEEGKLLPDIKDGDVVVCTLDGVVGFIYAFWPYYVVAQEIQTHAGVHVERGTFNKPMSWEDFLRDHPQYIASVKKCVEVAESDADITGNDHWAQASQTEAMQVALSQSQSA